MFIKIKTSFLNISQCCEEIYINIIKDKYYLNINLFDNHKSYEIKDEKSTDLLIEIYNAFNTNKQFIDITKYII